MAHQPPVAADYGVNGHGLRFLNDEWNDSISNGDPFTLKWNQTFAKAGAELGLFKVLYPADGVTVYNLVANLTGVYPGFSPGRFNSLIEWFHRFHGLCVLCMDSRGIGE
jgi:hypothetical protein